MIIDGYSGPYLTYPLRPPSECTIVSRPFWLWPAAPAASPPYPHSWDFPEAASWNLLHTFLSQDFAPDVPNMYTVPSTLCTCEPDSGNVSLVIFFKQL